MNLLRSHYCVVVMILMLTLTASCHPYAYEGPAYTAAREALNNLVNNLPLPLEAEILDQYDGVSTGKVEACRGVYTELLVGSNVPVTDVYQFYKDRLIAQGWKVKLEGERGIVLEKASRYGIEVSDNYYVSNGISRDKIRAAEREFVSLVYVNIGYGIYDPQTCQDAVDKYDN